MKYPYLFAAVVAINTFAVATSALAADWPCYLGPTHNNIAPDTGLNKDWAAKPPKVLWQTSLTDKGHAGPAVAHGKVFIVDHRGSDDVIRAIDLATGGDLWSYSYPDAGASRYGYTECTPLIQDGRVYVYSRLGKTICLDEATGKLTWARNTFADFSGRRPEWDYSASPAIIDGKLILLPGGPTASVVALDPQTAQPLWQSGASKPSYATPISGVLNGQSQLIVFVAEGLIGLNPSDGRQLWAFPWKVNYDQNTATPLVVGNRIFFSTAHGKGSAMLDLTDSQPKVLWKTLDMQSRFPNPVVYNGRVYGMQDPGKLVCLDAESGKLLWSKPGFEFPSTMAADGCIFVREGKTGDLILLDASVPDYREISRITPLPGPNCWTSPVLSDGRMLLRNETSLVCLDLR